MNNADWLAQLAPAHAPAASGWWPLAIGWWIVLLLLTIAVAAMIYWLTRPHVRARRMAMRELKKLQTEDEDEVLARELENLMRRYAMARFGRDAVAQLSGQRWLEFVVAHGATPLSGTGGESLLRAAYGGAVAPDRALWLAGAQAFFRGRS